MSAKAFGPAGPIDRQGLVYRWDLDKTYLRTEFDTLKDLFRRAIERASDKRTVPGAAALLREIHATGPAGIYMLSGSPEQMRKVLEAKLRLDGIRWDGLTLKPSLKNLLRGHLGYLKDQVGYKLSAMVAARDALRSELDEILFGDDAETDAFVYSLYADLCAGKVGRDVLLKVLDRSALAASDVARLLGVVDHLPKRDHCRRIFIHLDRMSPPEAFEVYGARVCPFYNYFQAALVLVELDALDASAALRVAADLVIDQAFTAEALIASYLDLARRGQLTQAAVVRSLDALHGVADFEYAGATATLQVMRGQLERLHIGVATRPEIAVLDYGELLARDRLRAHAGKQRVLGRR